LCPADHDPRGLFVRALPADRLSLYPAAARSRSELGSWRAGPSVALEANVPRNTPRGFQLIRAAIADIKDLGELAKLRALAREQWGDDPQHAELEALLDKRAAEVAGAPGTQLPLPLATIPAADPMERMMDQIASADSPAEVDWLWKRAHADFAGHPRLAALERAVEGKRLALGRREQPQEHERRGEV